MNPISVRVSMFTILEVWSTAPGPREGFPCILVGIPRIQARSVMPSFYNTNSNYGACSPFEATSKESLAETMHPTFRLWAEDRWEEDQDADLDSKGDYIAQAIDQMRREFIAGLAER
jgi:hypothetical protein